MKPERITDLEKFLHEHIKQPYKNQGVETDGITLDNFYEYITKYPDWWALVANRIERIGFKFPDYIQHELVDVIRSVCA
jgi:hypothetical protein